MIDLASAYEVRDVLSNEVIDKIEDEFGNIWYEAFKPLIASGVPPLTLLKCKGKTRSLPNEYQEVEYIQNEGNQYIDTGVLVSENNSFEVKAQ